MNESIYYNVDCIHSAIALNQKISFKYFEYSISKTKRYRNDGNVYIVSPYALLWDNENYYLVASYNKHTDPITNFRVDKMDKVQIIDEPKDEIDDSLFSLNNYTNKIFGMYGGVEETVKLQFNNSLVGVVIDRFGKDVRIEKNDDESFNISTNVFVSPVFFGWIFQFGDKVKILSPNEVKDKFIEHIKKTTNNYLEEIII